METEQEKLMDETCNHPAPGHGACRAAGRRSIMRATAKLAVKLALMMVLNRLMTMANKRPNPKLDKR